MVALSYMLKKILKIKMTLNLILIIDLQSKFRNYFILKKEFLIIIFIQLLLIIFFHQKKLNLNQKIISKIEKKLVNI